MKSDPAVQVGWTSGPDMAPLVAAVTALVCMHVQWNVVAYWDWATRSRAQGVQGTKVLFIVLILLFLHKLIMEFLVCLQVVLEGHGHSTQVARADVECRVHYMSCEGLMYLGICNIRGGCEVLEEIGGDVVLVGKYVP